MLPAPDGGGAPPSTNSPADQPVRTGHPTQGQTQASRPVAASSAASPRRHRCEADIPRRARSTVRPTPPATPASDPVQRNQPVRRPTPPPVRTGHPTQGQEVQARQHDRRTPNPGPAPEQQNDASTRAPSAMRGRSDQIEANGGALNQGTANTLNEFRDKPRVRRLAQARSRTPTSRSRRAYDHGRPPSSPAGSVCGARTPGSRHRRPQGQVPAPSPSTTSWPTGTATPATSPMTTMLSTASRIPRATSGTRATRTPTTSTRRASPATTRRTWTWSAGTASRGRRPE